MLFSNLLFSEFARRKKNFQVHLRRVRWEPFLSHILSRVTRPQAVRPGFIARQVPSRSLAKSVNMAVCRVWFVSVKRSEANTGRRHQPPEQCYQTSTSRSCSMTYSVYGMAYNVTTIPRLLTPRNRGWRRYFRVDAVVNQLSSASFPGEIHDLQTADRDRWPRATHTAEPVLWNERPGKSFNSSICGFHFCGY